MLSLTVLATAPTIRARITTYCDLLTWIEKVAELDGPNHPPDDDPSTLLRVVFAGTDQQLRTLERFLRERAEAGQLVYAIEPADAE